MSRQRKLRLLAGATLVLALFAVYRSSRRPVVLAPGPQPGDPAPAYAGVSFAGDSVSLASLRGDVVVLNVWATWCKPCLHEIPALKRLHAQYADSGLRVLGVSVDRDRDAAKRFAREHAMPWVNLHDSDDRLRRIFAFSKGVPKTILIDRTGTVRGFWYGQFDPAEPDKAGRIRAALVAPASATSPPRIGEATSS